jgi:hypothetical protein
VKQRASMRSIIVGLALLAVAGAWYLDRGSGDGGEPDQEAARGADPGLIADRVWVDSQPEKYTDYMQVLLVARGSIGLFQKSSAYHATLELFQYRRHDAQMAFLFPQSGKKRETRFRIRTCNDLPPFDLCLELDHNPWGGPRRYYGISDPDQERAELGDLRHQLEHRLVDPSAAD